MTVDPYRMDAAAEPERLEAPITADNNLAHLDPVRRPRRDRVLSAVSTVLPAVSPACHQLVCAAAILGPHIDPELVAEMLGQATGALLPAWQEALDRGVLSSSDGKLIFASESLRHAALESLPAAIRRALARQRDQLASENAADAPPAPAARGDDIVVPAGHPLSRLTAREKAVMALLARGRSNHQIARALGISDHAVKRHVSNLFMKFDCSNRTELALLAVGA
ncbi:MAG TPA: LuxR C-terminal-related transcriptional regulator [Streptosporangiaceae bacterium]|nr:LuxR C-terminal-related transcriptional regulator [Streptosporangiaceae bacterium]